MLISNLSEKPVLDLFVSDCGIFSVFHDAAINLFCSCAKVNPSGACL
jgi:hypothetical protein